MYWYFSTQSTLLPQSSLTHSYKRFIFYAEALLMLTFNVYTITITWIDQGAT